MQGGLINPETSRQEVGGPFGKAQCWSGTMTSANKHGPSFQPRPPPPNGPPGKPQYAQANPTVCNSARPLYKGLKFFVLINILILRRFLVYIVGLGVESLRSQ